MKKKLSFLVLLMLILCLVGFAVEKLAPASQVHAASDAHPAIRQAPLAGKTTLPAKDAAQPVVFVAAGLVCLLFGVMAVVPLLIDDPAGRAPSS